MVPWNSEITFNPMQSTIIDTTTNHMNSTMNSMNSTMNSTMTGDDHPFTSILTKTQSGGFQIPDIPGVNLPVELIVALAADDLVRWLLRQTCSGLAAAMLPVNPCKNFLAETLFSGNIETYDRMSASDRIRDIRIHEYRVWGVSGLFSSQCIEDFYAFHMPKSTIIDAQSRGNVSQIVGFLIRSGRPDAADILRDVLDKYPRILEHPSNQFRAANMAINSGNIDILRVILAFKWFCLKIEYGPLVCNYVVRINETRVKNANLQGHVDMAEWLTTYVPPQSAD